MKHDSHHSIVPVLLLLFCMSASDIRAGDCDGTGGATFTVNLPKVDKAWLQSAATADAITIPNGRPIYALIVGGYGQNHHFDELLTYDFARHLMSKGAYVHFAWWNNLLAPYMERPLHLNASEPGNLFTNFSGFIPFGQGIGSLGEKAVPADDYQFQSDALLFLRAIRKNNPSAIIIVVGHSMGGGAVARLGTDALELIDILAPIDPVENRGLPLGMWFTKTYNYTRWRISRNEFRGYKLHDCTDRFFGVCTVESSCIGLGDWQIQPQLIMTLAPFKCPGSFIDLNPPRRIFKKNVINLFHAYQHEAIFPMDFPATEHFVHNRPPGGTSFQESFAMCKEGNDPNGFQGKCWPGDGHGEIIGIRGDPLALKGIGLKVRTSSDCADWDHCADAEDRDWPRRTFFIIGGWNNGDSQLRRQRLLNLESSPSSWPHRPTHPDLCKVSPGLIDLFDNMNRWPSADAGDDIIIECTGKDGGEVTLDGTASTDPDGDQLSYTWQSPSFGEVSGAVITVLMPFGTHSVTLTVTDKVGHPVCDVIDVTVQDTTGPEITIELYPISLWPPNHELVDIQALVTAEDLCGEVVSLDLVSIVSSEPDNGLGDGDTFDDIQSEDPGTLDESFQLRAERSGRGRGRTYTVTYQATDESGNRTETSATVIVKNLPPGKPRGFTVSYGTGSGNHLAWQKSADPDFQHFALYRSTDENFTPKNKYLVHTTSSTSWIDPDHDGEGIYYKITTVDQTRLESAPASPEKGSDGNDGQQSIRFALHQFPLDPLNVNSFGGEGDLSSRIAILGSEALDIRDLDPSTMSIMGVSPISWSYEDIATPSTVDGSDCVYSDVGPDGYDDLMLEFDASTNFIKSDRTSDNGEVILDIIGKFTDGADITGYACILLKSLGETVAAEGEQLSVKFDLAANFPNPFNPSTELSFTLPVATHATLEVFNIMGQRVVMLLDGYLEAGTHTVMWEAGNVASGVYFYRLRAGAYISTRKMMLLK